MASNPQPAPSLPSPRALRWAHGNGCRPSPRLPVEAHSVLPERPGSSVAPCCPAACPEAEFQEKVGKRDRLHIPENNGALIPPVRLQGLASEAGVPLSEKPRERALGISPQSSR